MPTLTSTSSAQRDVPKPTNASLPFKPVFFLEFSSTTSSIRRRVKDGDPFIVHQNLHGVIIEAGKLHDESTAVYHHGILILRVELIRAEFIRLGFIRAEFIRAAVILILGPRGLHLPLKR